MSPLQLRPTRESRACRHSLAVRATLQAVIVLLRALTASLHIHACEGAQNLQRFHALIFILLGSRKAFDEPSAFGCEIPLELRTEEGLGSEVRGLRATLCNSVAAVAPEPTFRDKRAGTTLYTPACLHFAGHSVLRPIPVSSAAV